MKQEVYYYSDELNDDFAKLKFKDNKGKEEFEYIQKSKLKRFMDFMFFHLIATPVGYLYLKCKLHVKIKNKKVIKPYKRSGYFLYGNHTLMAGDAFIPGLISYPIKDFIITDNDSASNGALECVTKALGSLPLPSNLRGLRKFHEALIYRINKGNPIVIYPEAHVWPYYTKIRPFKDTSFHYPIETNKPVFTFTVTHHLRKGILGKNKVIVYIDGPFFKRDDLSAKDNRKYLRDLAYNAMVERSKLNSYEFIKYVKKEANSEDNLLN